jgi:hypothetical protein
MTIEKYDLNFSFTRNNGVSWYLFTTNLLYLRFLYSVTFSVIFTAPDHRQAGTYRYRPAP